MKKNKILRNMLLFAAISALAFAIGCSQATGSGTTATTPGTTTTASAPIINATVPIDTTTAVSLNTTINATFNKAMNPTSFVTGTGFKLYAGSSVVAGTASYDSTSLTANFAPTAALAANTTYMATITTAAVASDGGALAANYSWTFTTGSTANTTPPTVSSVSPANSATGVAVNGSINATFSEAMNTATIIAANFTLSGGVTGTVTYNAATKTATFAPSANLGYNTSYTATIKSAVKDSTGNVLGTDYAWSFTTAAKGAGPAPVLLGSAINYVILAKTAISTVPQSSITGDIGVSPAAETYLTGFSQTKHTGYSISTQVTGNMYAADMTPPTPSKMTVAILDMQAAYVDAAGRPTPDYTNKGAGEIGSLTLTAGLYTWNTSVTVSNDVTLSGGANDVWIFQMSGDLTLASGKKVILSGGAQAKNVFWQVGGGKGAILNTTSHLEGIVLSQKAIAFGTGSSLNGRAFAQSAVTLDTTTITSPITSP